eukprot:COSAG06_NODE_3009_length_5963_cov_14.390177_2_plen_145_part_00
MPQSVDAVLAVRKAECLALLGPAHAGIHQLARAARNLGVLETWEQVAAALGLGVLVDLEEDVRRRQIDALIAEAQAGLSQSGIDLDAISTDQLSRVLQTEVQQRLDMSGIKDRLTDAGQATASAAAEARTAVHLITIEAQAGRV